MILIVLLLIVLYILLSPRKEGFKEIFGLSGYNKPVDHVNIQFKDTQFDGAGEVDLTDSEGVSNDDVNMVLNTLEPFIKKETNLCVHPIETNRIRKFKNDKGVIFFKCRFMYVTTNTSFPFSFGVNALISNGKVVSASTQKISSDSTENVKAFKHELSENFVAFDRIEKFSPEFINAYSK